MEFRGKNKTHTGDVGGVPAKISLAQGEGSGYQIEIHRKFQPFSATLFYRKWEVDDSETSVVTLPGLGTILGVEPKNNTSSYGARLNYHF